MRGMRHTAAMPFYTRIRAGIDERLGPFRRHEDVVRPDDVQRPRMQARPYFGQRIRKYAREGLVSRNEACSDDTEFTAKDHE